MTINTNLISPNLNILLHKAVDVENSNSLPAVQTFLKETSQQSTAIPVPSSLNNMISTILEPLENLIYLLNTSKDENVLKELLNIIPKLDKNLSVQLSQFTEKIIPNTQEKFSFLKWVDKDIKSKIDILPLKSMDSFFIKDDEHTNGWKMILFPILDGPKILPLKFYYRHSQQELDQEENSNKNRQSPKTQTRFVAEFNLLTIGLIQFDGLIDPQTFRLYLRCQTALPEPIQKDIKSLFNSILNASHKNGDLFFETHNQLPKIVIIEDKNDQRPLLI